jgi:hypothetical protein
MNEKKQEKNIFFKKNARKSFLSVKNFLNKRIMKQKISRLERKRKNNLAKLEKEREGTEKKLKKEKEKLLLEKKKSFLSILEKNNETEQKYLEIKKQKKPLFSIILDSFFNTKVKKNKKLEKNSLLENFKVQPPEKIIENFNQPKFSEPEKLGFSLKSVPKFFPIEDQQKKIFLENNSKIDLIKESDSQIKEKKEVENNIINELPTNHTDNNKTEENVLIKENKIIENNKKESFKEIIKEEKNNKNKEKQDKKRQEKEKMARLFSQEIDKQKFLIDKNKTEKKVWSVYGNLKANLAKDEMVVFLRWGNKIILFFFLFFLSIFLISLCYGGLLLWQKNKIKENFYVYENYININKEIAKKEKVAKEILEFNDKLIVLNFILNNHVYWTNFFKTLEDYTITNVYYENFEGDLSGKYLLPGIAKDFNSIYLQLKLLSSANNILNVDTSGGETVKNDNVIEPINSDKNNEESLNEIQEKVKFKVNLLVDKKIFLK